MSGGPSRKWKGEEDGSEWGGVRETTGGEEGCNVRAWEKVSESEREKGPGKGGGKFGRVERAN